MNILLSASFTDILKKINDAIGKFWWIFLAVAVFLCIILFIVIACKNKRIRKLKDENNRTRIELETEKSRSRNEQLYAPVTGTQNLFGEQTEQAPAQPAAQPAETTAAQSAPAQPAAKPAPKSEPTVQIVNAPKSAPAQPAPQPTVNEEYGTVTVEMESEPEPVKKTKNTSSLADEVSRLSYYNRASVVSQKEGNSKFIVKYDRNKDSWVIKKEGVDRVVRRVDTKEEAMNIARQLCKKYDANLVVHKKDGKFQKQ